MAAVVPRPSATVALLRDGPRGPEVLLTHRPATMAFGPGLHVFPGGAVDPGDGDSRLVARSIRQPAACAAALVGELPPDAAIAHHVAAVRELFEEAGVLLAQPAGGGKAARATDRGARLLGEARAGRLPFADLVEALDLVLRTDLLVPLSRWVTPPVMARRYDAWFFVAWLPPGDDASLAGDEVAAHEWLTPRDALAASAAGRIELWMPTSTTLRQLAPVRNLGDVRERLAPRAAASAPVVERVGPGVVRVRLGGAGGIPGQAVNTYLVGRRRLAVVDPGDPGDEAAEAILAAAAAAGGSIASVLLTSPVPDHAAGAESLALRLGVTVAAAPGAAGFLPHAMRPLVAGDATDLADVAIRVHATPGTHPAHLAFELPGEGIVLVGDLLGERPSRSIPDAVDAAALAASRALVAGLGAAIVQPAHGAALRGDGSGDRIRPAAS